MAALPYTLHTSEGRMRVTPFTTKAVHPSPCACIHWPHQPTERGQVAGVRWVEVAPSSVDAFGCSV